MWQLRMATSLIITAIGIYMYTFSSNGNRVPVTPVTYKCENFSFLNHFISLRDFERLYIVARTSS